MYEKLKDLHPAFAVLVWDAYHGAIDEEDLVLAEDLLEDQAGLRTWQMHWLYMLIGGNMAYRALLCDTLKREAELWLSSNNEDQA